MGLHVSRGKRYVMVGFLLHCCGCYSIHYVAKGTPFPGVQATVVLELHDVILYGMRFSGHFESYGETLTLVVCGTRISYEDWVAGRETEEPPTYLCAELVGKDGTVLSLSGVDAVHGGFGNALGPTLEASIWDIPVGVRIEDISEVVLVVGRARGTAWRESPEDTRRENTRQDRPLDDDSASEGASGDSH
ncbi:MAG: hypothetical protein ACYS9X_27210 [Planctomycetota bacterium]|jgi:hypothetical protein